MRHLAGRLSTAALSALFVAVAGTGVLAQSPAPDASAPATVDPAPPAAAAPPAPVVQAEPGIGALASQAVSRVAARTTAKDDAAAVIAFYAAKPEVTVWTTENGWNAAATNALAELGKADEWGLAAKDYTIAPLPAGPLDRAIRAEAEARLSLALLHYARDARGGRMDPTQLSESIVRTAQVRDSSIVMQQLASSQDPAATLRKMNPQQPQFERLRKLYNELRVGKAEAVAAPEPEDAPATGNGRNKTAKSKPKATPELLTAQRVLLNMEEWRWMPEDLGAFYVTVNLPEFTVRVVKNGEVIHSERVVAGEVSKQTPIFSKDMQSIVFHPGWGVPNSIKVKELLPGLLAGRDTLTRSGLRATYRGRQIDPTDVDWSSVDIRHLDVVQPPGPGNVLGVVKFQFPNKDDIYMHDTPTKNLFNADVRAFSHGCMRVRNPLKLAQVIFAEDQGWAPEKVVSLVQHGPMDNKVMLAHPFPVHITYFTVTVDDDGKPHTFRDVYSHEQKIQLGLEGKANQIPHKREDLTVARNEAVGARVRYRSQGDWLSNVFGGF